MTGEERTVYRAMLGGDEPSDRLVRLHDATAAALLRMGRDKVGRELMALMVGIVTSSKVGRPKGS